MSRSEKHSGQGRLLVEAPLGVEISVADGALREVASGVTRLDQTLGEGVYAIKTTAAGRVQQKIVRIREGQTARFEPSPPDRLEVGFTTEMLSRSAEVVVLFRDIRSRPGSQNNRVPLEARPDGHSSITVLVSDETGLGSITPFQHLRLLTANGTSVLSASDLTGCHTGPGTPRGDLRGRRDH
ncbi:hypothetical protein ABZT49_08960 [Methylobacterium sp. EM32]|uniref:hypothetical protein n=1 Tax=Methylobacterium sp. EM32 TaxID=3163481 RepID=UPI00339E55BB